MKTSPGSLSRCCCAGSAPADARFALEVKWDGMRGQVRVTGAGRVCVRSRPGRDCSSQFRELAGIADVLAARGGVALDGELACLDASGKPRFERLQARLRARSQRAIAQASRRDLITFMAFDVLHCAGLAWSQRPYVERRALLEDLELDEDAPAWCVPRSWPVDSADL